MAKFIIDSDPISASRSTFQYDAGTDQYILRDEQDVTGIVEANRAMRNDTFGRHPKDGLGRQVASIPLGLFFELYKKGVTRNKRDFARWLNDPDNRYFRTDTSVV